jgi:hypothetical protein
MVIPETVRLAQMRADQRREALNNGLSMPLVCTRPDCLLYCLISLRTQFIVPLVRWLSPALLSLKGAEEIHEKFMENFCC